MRPLLVLLGAAAALIHSAALGAQTSPNPELGGTPPPLHADPAPLTLSEALALATSRSFALSAARREVEAHIGSVAQAGVRRNPQFNASVEDTQRRTRVATGTVDIPFELGGKRAARVAAAERSGDVARSDVARATADLRAAVASAFDKVSVAQERICLAGDSAEIASRSAEATARRVAAGKVSPVEETRARVDLANARLEVDEAGTELRTARYALASFWTDGEPTFGAVEANLDALPTAGVAPERLAGDVAAAPVLVSRRLQIEHRRALVDVERSKRSPDVTLNVGLRRDNEIGRTQAVVGFSVPLPLFDRNDGALGEADRRVAQAEDEYEDARIRLTGEVRQALAELDASRRTAETLRSTVLPAAQALYDAANKGFAAGKFGFLDVLDAQRTLLQSRTRYLTALATTRQASTTLDRLLGR